MAAPLDNSLCDETPRCKPRGHEMALPSMRVCSGGLNPAEIQRYGCGHIDSGRRARRAAAHWIHWLGTLVGCLVGASRRTDQRITNQGCSHAGATDYEIGVTTHRTQAATAGVQARSCSPRPSTVILVLGQRQSNLGRSEVGQRVEVIRLCGHKHNPPTQRPARPMPGPKMI